MPARWRRYTLEWTRHLDSVGNPSPDSPPPSGRSRPSTRSVIPSVFKAIEFLDTTGLKCNREIYRQPIGLAERHAAAIKQIVIRAEKTMGIVKANLQLKAVIATKQTTRFTTFMRELLPTSARASASLGYIVLGLAGTILLSFFACRLSLTHLRSMIGVRGRSETSVSHV